MADEKKVVTDEEEALAGQSENTLHTVSRRNFLISSALAAGYITLQPSEIVEAHTETHDITLRESSETPAAQTPSTGYPVSLTINGREQTVIVEPRWTLNYLLREKLGLTGTKTGCNRQMCGMCTVLANGRPIYSCTTLVVDFEGQEILTIEGLARQGELHPIQQAFIEYNAFQCAWCTPGFILSAVALLNQNPNPSLDEMKQALAGNLCRCGAYREIFQAVEAAAQMMA